MLVALAGVVVGLAIAALSGRLGKGLIILVRHAERVPSPATDDPPLTDAGSARAQRLATMLARSDVRAVFVTRFRRTLETAKLLTDLLRLVPIEESDTCSSSPRSERTPTRPCWWSGTRIRCPTSLEAFGGPTVTIGDDDFDDLSRARPRRRVRSRGSALNPAQVGSEREARAAASARREARPRI